jgi:hypothetical protein
MIKKTLAGLATAAMLLPVGFITASPASAEVVECSFKLIAPDKTKTDGNVYVRIRGWQYNGASVKPLSVTIYNNTGRSITVSEDRWQNSDGKPPDRGFVGEIRDGYITPQWTPPTFIPTNQTPYIGITAYATTRPGMSNGVKLRINKCEVLR